MARPYDLQSRDLAMPIKYVKQSRSSEFDRSRLLVLILLGGGRGRVQFAARRTSW